MEPTDYQTVCANSHLRLLKTVSALSESDCRADSRLPGFTRSHVISHICNKADAHVFLFEGAALGEVRHLHPDGYNQNDAAEEGSSRSADELRTVLSETLDRLEMAWERCDAAGWSSEAVMTAGPRNMAQVIAHHLRNIEVHHVDLDAGYEPSQWPDAFLESELSKRLRDLPDRTDHRALLAWLVDRAPAPELVRPW